MNDDERAIRALIAEWHRATGASDVATVLELMHEDAVFLVAGHPALRGRGAFEEGLRRVLATHRIESHAEVREVQAAGELAFAWSELEVRMIPIAGGEAMVRRGPVLSVFRKTHGRWQLIRDANLLTPVGERARAR